jgi:hypothetical protein
VVVGFVRSIVEDGSGRTISNDCARINALVRVQHDSVEFRSTMESRQPASGDVVIAPDPVSGRGFTLSIAPDGPSQLWYASYEEAFRKAVAWASASDVSVWRRDGPAKFVSVQRISSESSQRISSESSRIPQDRRRGC